MPDETQKSAEQQGNAAKPAAETAAAATKEVVHGGIASHMDLQEKIVAPKPLTGLAAWFHDLCLEAKSKLNEIGAEVKTLAEKIEPVVVADFEEALRDLGKIALDAVIAEAPKVISGQEKFGNAVATVVQKTEAAGKPVLMADAQMAVQGSFHALQIELGSAPQPAS